MTVALAIICVVMSVLQPDAFASADNFYNITRNFAFIGIMALGMTAVIITGGIDLSVGSIMGFVGVVCGVILQAGYPWWIAIVGGLAARRAAGRVNGVLIAYVGLSPFVVTLGMLSLGALARRGAVAEPDDLQVRPRRPDLQGDRRRQPVLGLSPIRSGSC